MSEVGIDKRNLCVQCGSDVSAGRFCGNCGAAVIDQGAVGPDPDPPPDPAADSDLAADPARRPSVFTRAMRWVARRRSPIVIIPLLGALLVAGGLGARMLLAEVPAPPESGSPVTCWDGTEAPAAAACDLPTGRDGLSWVFPSFRPDRGSCRDVLVEHPEYPRPTMWECDAEVDGQPVLITYSELTGVKEGLSFHEREYAGSRREDVVPPGRRQVYRYVWRRALGDGRFDATSIFVDFPYAVRVVAADARVRDRSLATLVEFRLSTDLRVSAEESSTTKETAMTGRP